MSGFLFKPSFSTYPVDISYVFMSNTDRILLGSTVTNLVTTTNFLYNSVDICNIFAKLYNQFNVSLDQSTYTTGFMKNNVDISTLFMLNPSNVSLTSSSLSNCREFKTTIGKYTYSFFINTLGYGNGSNGTANITLSSTNMQTNYAVINILLVGGGAGGYGTAGGEVNQRGGAGGAISIYSNLLAKIGQNISISVGGGGAQGANGSYSNFIYGSSEYIANPGKWYASTQFNREQTAIYNDGYTSTGYYSGGAGGGYAGTDSILTGGNSSFYTGNYFTTSSHGVNLNNAMINVYNNNTSQLNGYNIYNFSLSTLSGGGGGSYNFVRANAGNGVGGGLSNTNGTGGYATNCGGGGGAGGFDGQNGGNGANGLVVIWYKSSI